MKLWSCQEERRSATEQSGHSFNHTPLAIFSRHGMVSSIPIELITLGIPKQCRECWPGFRQSCSPLEHCKGGSGTTAARCFSCRFCNCSWVKQSWPMAPLCWLAHMPAEKCHGTEAGDSSFHSFSSSFRGTDSSFLALHQEGIPVFEGQILVTVYCWLWWEFFFYKYMKHLHNCELDSMYSSSSKTSEQILSKLK